MQRWITIFCGLLLVVAANMSGASMSYSRMAGELAKLSHTCPYVKLYKLGPTASKDRSLWLVSLTNPKNDPRKVVRIFFLCGENGDETVATEAAL